MRKKPLPLVASPLTDANARALDPNYAPERFDLFIASRARDSRATLVGVAVWFISIRKRAPDQREGWSYARNARQIKYAS